MKKDMNFTMPVLLYNNKNEIPEIGKEKVIYSILIDPQKDIYDNYLWDKDKFEYEHIGETEGKFELHTGLNLKIEYFDGLTYKG